MILYVFPPFQLGRFPRSDPILAPFWQTRSIGEGLALILIGGVLILTIGAEEIAENVFLKPDYRISLSIS